MNINFRHQTYKPIKIHQSNNLHRFEKKGAYKYFWIQNKTSWRPEIQFCRNCGMEWVRISQQEDVCPNAMPLTIGGI